MLQTQVINRPIRQSPNSPKRQNLFFQSSSKLQRRVSSLTTIITICSAGLPSSSFPLLSPPRPRTLSSSFTPFKSFISAISIATAAPPQTVEHIALFKIKDGTDPSKINSMVSSLNGLISLDPVLHITAGPIYRTKSSPLPFTHILHSRHSSKEALAEYFVHPIHVSVGADFVRPIRDDVMAVDWVADDVDGALTPPPPGSVMRVTLLKLKENVGVEARDEILGTIKGMKGIFQGIDQMSCGENFSPGRSKGYSIGSLAVFPGLSELEAVDSNEAWVNLQKEKVRDCLEIIVLDSLVSSPQFASLS